MLVINIQVLIVSYNLDNIFSYSQAGKVDSNVLDIADLKQIEIRKVRVGDIGIAYKIIGIGDPILLINGFSTPLDLWDPTFVSKLASKQMMVTFDNMGIGIQLLEIKKFSIKQFANDTAGLLDALRIKKADVIGWSWGNDCSGISTYASGESRKTCNLWIIMLWKRICTGKSRSFGKNCKSDWYFS